LTICQTHKNQVNFQQKTKKPIYLQNSDRNHTPQVILITTIDNRLCSNTIMVVRYFSTNVESLESWLYKPLGKSRSFLLSLLSTL
jgi:hypothetical protein